MSIETTGSIVAILVPLAALLVWTMRAIVAPLKVVIENNTQAMNKIMGTVESHAGKLEDHGIRIACIETRHELEASE
jgi:hypothetical protein